MNTAKKTIGLAHKTFLFSVGAGERGLEIAVNKLDQLFVEGSELVNDLLERGESFETQTQAKIKAKKMLKGKISALKTRLGIGNESREQQIDMLSQRVDSLIEVVAKLAQNKAAEKKTTPSASTPKKAVSKVTKAPAIAKAAATKPAVAKAAATKPAVAKAAATKPTVAKVTATQPTSAKPAATEPSVIEPVVAKTADGEPVGKSNVDGKD